MKFLKKPFQYGSLILPSNIFYSPLAGCSNLPFRHMAAIYGRPGLHYCEMVKMQALWRLERATLQMLDYNCLMQPLAAQLVGSDPKIAGGCARILEDMGFSSIDLNCGCPVDKVTKDGSGSAMLLQPQLIAETLANMKAKVKIPISLKIRAGWDEGSINAPDIAVLAEQAGATAITIHARTREQGYKGPANWEHIKNCKLATSKILVIGNGDLFSPQATLDMFEQTGCDGVMISRGCMGKPWIAQECESYLSGKPIIPTTLCRALQALKHHYEIAQSYLPERKAIIEMRKVSCWYLEGFSHAKMIRSELAHAQTAEQVQDKLEILAKA
jgi:tRNA-dihydrouridine synthase B